MVFSSFEFLFRFLPIFLIIYFIAPKRCRNFVLFVGSIVFYTIGEAEFILLLLASVIVNYTVGRLMYRHKEEGRGRRQLFLLLFALCYNFGFLIFFKYSGLSTELPLGISFYTFQIVAYVIDVYRGQVPAERSLVNLGTYLTMFPQLVAGPIVNYSEIRLSLIKREISVSTFEDGMKTLIIGLASKVILADRIGILWNNIQTIGFASISTPLAWIGAFAYSFELYFDFVGYSLMAMGLGKMLGFEIPVNFYFPYISKSVTEFWRRWHITLGRWFRDYVYIPLGGNRKGKARTFLNLAIVWILTALWHGAAPNFLVWGGMLFVLLLIEKLFLLQFLNKSRVLSHLYLIIVVPVTWVAFSITNLKQLSIYFTRMFPFLHQARGIVNHFDYLKYLNDYGPLLLICVLFATPIPAAVYEKCKTKPVGILGIFILLFMSIYYLAISNNNPFLYFNF